MVKNRRLPRQLSSTKPAVCVNSRIRDTGYRTWLLAELETSLANRQASLNIVQAFEQMRSLFSLKLSVYSLRE